MARLPQVSDTKVLTQQPRSSVSAADVADPFNSFAVALDGIGKAFEREELKDASTAGSAAVVRDADGNLTVAENPYGGFGKMADAWERSAHMALLARGAIDDRAAAQKFALEANGNNDNFMAAWTPYKSKRVQGVPEAVSADVEINLDDLGQQTSGGIIAAARKRDDQVFAADHEALAQAQRNDILQLARSGGMSSRAFKTALSQYKSLRGEMIANPAFSYSKVQYDAELKQLESAATAEGLIGQAERVFEEKGPRAAIDFADEVLTRTDLGLSPGSARTLNGLMRGRIEDLRAGHSVETKALEVEADNVIKLFDLGQGMDNPVVDVLAERLSQNGKGAKASELRRKRTVANVVKSLRAPGVTPADRLAAMEQLAGRANGAPRVAPTLRTLGQSGPSAARAYLLAHTDKDASHIDGMNAAFGEKLAALMQAAPPGIREGLGVYSGFRSIERQRQLWEASDKTGRTVARPGHSLHNKGKAADLGYNGRSLSKAPKEVVDWVHANAGQFGLKFPMSYEPWHIEDSSTRGGRAEPPSIHDDSVPDADVVKAVIGENTEDVRIAWPSIRDGWTRYGTHDSQELVTFAQQLPWVDDEKLKTEITTFFQSQEGARLVDALPPVEREAVVAALKGDASDGATVAQLGILDAIDKQQAATAAAISADAQQFSRDKYSPIVGAVPPVDIGQGVDAFGKSLDAAQRHANFLRQREGVGPVPAFTKPEAARFGQFLTTAPPEAVASVLGIMDDRLDPETFNATIDALGKSKQAKAFAAAGALQPVAPDVAASVLRGQALLAANPLLAPKETDENRVAIDATLPPKNFVPTLEGPRQELLEAARLRYADLSAQSGDTSGELKGERMKQAVSDVVGGFNSFNGEDVIAPVYGMSQVAFDERIAGLTDDDLRGAIAADGTQITASDFRRYYRLKSVGDGEYAISYGGSGVPQFLLRAADPRSHSPRAFDGFFILDLGAK